MRKAPENPNPKFVFSPEQIETVRRLTAEGVSRKKTAEAVGVSIDTLRRHFRGELGVRQKNVWEWTDEQRKVVAALAGFGAVPAEIGRLLGCTEARVRRDFEKEIDTAPTEMTAIVATSVFNAARSGNVVAAMFWLRARAGWDDSSRSRRVDPIVTLPGELPAEISAEATRANIREAARHLTAAGRSALRTVVDELQSNEARLVNG